MDPAYVLTMTVISLALLSAVAMVFTNSFALAILRKRSVWIVMAITLAAMMKYPFDNNIFSGLEYEDAFIYNAAARLKLSEKTPALPREPFLTASCSYGSLIACDAYSTYSGHVIGYPAVIVEAAKIFGYRPHLANFVSFSASVLCAGVLLILALLISNSLVYGAVAVLIFVLLPLQNLFATASVAEPFSSLFMALSLLCYLLCIHFRPLDLHPWRSLISWTGLFLVWWACILVKRELALAIGLLPAITVLLSLLERRPLRSLSWALVPISCIWLALACFYVGAIDVASTIRGEAHDVGNFPFSLSFLPKLLPVFLATLFDWRLFFIFSALLPLAIVAVVQRPTRPQLIVYPIALFFAYLLIYSLHYRSYYFIQTGDVTEFDTYRYLVLLVPLYSLIAAAGFQYCWESRAFASILSGRIGQFLIACVCGIVLVLSLIQSSNLRTYYSDIESINRLDAVSAVLRLPKPKHHLYAILTDDVLLFQIWGDGTEFLVDSRELEDEREMVGFAELIRSRTVYYVKKPYHDEAIERNRYSKGFNFLSKLKMQTQFEDPSGRFVINLLIPPDQP